MKVSDNLTTAHWYSVDTDYCIGYKNFNIIPSFNLDETIYHNPADPDMLIRNVEIFIEPSETNILKPTSREHDTNKVAIFTEIKSFVSPYCEFAGNLNTLADEFELRGYHESQIEMVQHLYELSHELPRKCNDDLNLVIEDYNRNICLSELDAEINNLAELGVEEARIYFLELLYRTQIAVDNYDFELIHYLSSALISAILYLN